MTFQWGRAAALEDRNCTRQVQFWEQEQKESHLPSACERLDPIPCWRLPRKICLLCKYAPVPTLLSPSVLLHFYSFHGQWASLRLVWWQLLALYSAKEAIWLHMGFPVNKSVHDLNLFQAYHSAEGLCWFSKAIHDHLQSPSLSQTYHKALKQNAGWSTMRLTEKGAK